MGSIYLVEDHTIVRDGLRSMLLSGGHTVVGETGDLGLASQELRALRPDLLLLDLGLEGHSGLELLQELKRRESSVRTIVLTMSLRPSDVAQAIQFGAAGYLLKDASRQELLGAVDTVLRGGRHFGEAAAELARRAESAAAGSDRLAELSPRERQIILLVVNGHSSTAIGEQLHLSPKTVDTYRSRLMAKLGVADVTALVRLAVRAGLIDRDSA